MKIPEKITELIDLFDRNIEAYKSGHYKETQVRHEFIDPLFMTLGWDVNNEKGYAEAYKDVIHEDSIKVGGIPKAPDYCFRIGGVRKFFLEAKKPSVYIKEETHPAYQLRRYAWSAKLPLSILTDFEEFAVYDCRIKPVKTDKASTARIFYVTYKEYHERWADIASIFSNEAILKGSFDKYVESTKAKRGTAEVDKAFLKEIELWREILARNIALRNPRLTRRELNFSVQRTIDRIIFLRICEDRGIEDYGRLMSLFNGAQVYKRLCELFYRADELYNSGLFHFNAEKGYQEPPDELTLSLVIDDKPITNIIKNLYYPDSPYEFSVLPADILGQVYEQFLGKVIHLTRGHRAVVEDKPEVKKAGGVYYTPTYIVDYIVKNTVGKLLEDKTPKHISKLKILDPACGSGSFLIGAYQYLLDWHREWYEKDDPEKWAKSRKPTLCRGSGGDWRLTTEERKRILLNNIYGVDIDQQAVEVTKLSLLLKVLEGENQQTLSVQYKIFHERALPNLSSNIKCGNSLIGRDFYDGKQLDMFDEEERYRINVFDWNAEFTEIMKNGGFDVVIGNPPWAFTKYVDWGNNIKDYIKNNYLSVSDNKSKANQPGKINLYAIFIIKSLNILKENGLFSYIIPNTILRTTIYDIIRKHILKFSKIKQIVNFNVEVFHGVTASPIIIILENKKPNKKNQIHIIDNNEYGVIQKGKKLLLQSECIKNPSYVIDIFTNESIRYLFVKIDSVSINLGSVISVLNGIATFKNKAGVLEKREDVNSKPLLFGRDISRYYFTYSGKHINYVKEKLLRPRDENIFLSKEKLIMQRIGGILITAYDNQKYYTFNSINNLILKDKVEYSIKYILGLLNSKLLRNYYILRFTNRSALTVNISKTFLDKIPLKQINFTDPTDKAHHDCMVNLVENMLSLQKKLASAKTTHEKEVIKRQIDATDRQIDKLVYELYGLTEEEIKIVEGET